MSIPRRQWNIIRTENGREYSITLLPQNDSFVNSSVYAASDTTNGGKFFCKELTCDDPERQNPDRELQAHRELSGKRGVHIATCFDFAPAPPTRFGPTYYLLFDYYHGGDLIDLLLNRREGLPETDARRMGKNILEALFFMHGVGWAHRDVKPDNILLTGPWDVAEALLADLGHAGTIPEDGLFKSEHELGTPGYRAPELILRQPYSSKVDIWAFGVTFYMMLTFREPFPNAKKYPEDHEEWVLAGQYWTSDLDEVGVSEEGKRAIAWMLSPDPAQRPTAEELLTGEYFGGDEWKPIPAPLPDPDP